MKKKILIFSAAAVLLVLTGTASVYFILQAGKNNSTTSTTTTADNNAQMNTNNPGDRGMGGRGISGEVTAVSSNGLTITADDGTTYTISTSDSTTCTAQVESDAATVLAEGNTISVNYTVSDNANIASRIIKTTALSMPGNNNFSGPAPSGTPDNNNNGNSNNNNNNDKNNMPGGDFNGETGSGKFFMGTVSSLSGNTLTAKAAMGPDTTEKTFDLSAATYYTTETSSLQGLQVGDTIKVSGTISGNSITATTIEIQ